VLARDRRVNTPKEVPMLSHARRLTQSALALVLVLTGLLIAAAPALADTLRGHITDPQQRPVASAGVIVVTHPGGHIVASVKTGDDGAFGPVDLPDGRYEVLVAAPGLRAAPQPLALSAGGSADLQIRLELAAVSEAVVVSAAQVDTPLSHATDSVTVIDRAALQTHQTDTVADALRLVPGFHVAASGTPGALTSIFPRGGESDYTLVLVDGIEQNSFGGGFDAAHLSAADVDHIEVVRGPQSALDGDGAIGGIVDVVTRQGGPLRADASFERGGYGTSSASASAAGSAERWSWGTAVDWLSTRGDTRTFASAGGPVSNDDYQRVSGSASLGWSDRPGRRIRVVLRSGHNERGVPGPYGSDPLGLYGGIDDISRGLNTTYEAATTADFGTAAVHHHVAATWANLGSRYLSPYGDSTDRTRRLTGRYQVDLEGGAGGLSAGWEIARERDDNSYITGEVFEPVPVRRTDSGWFVEGRPSLGDRLFITAGTRLERIERSALEGNPSAFNPRPAFGPDVVWSLNPKLSAAWFAQGPDTRGWTRLRVGAGTGIKPPTAFDIAFTDNPDLKPERSRSFDVGVEQALAGSTLVADVTWFANRYNDLIVAVGSSLAGASRYRTDNIANARARGVEAGLNWRPRASLSIRGAWTWLDTEVLGVDHLPSAAPTPYVVGDPLVRRPRRQGSIDATWTGRRGSAFVIVNGRSAMADLEPNFGATVLTNPGDVVVTVGGSISLDRHLDLYGRVSNALNRSYEEVLGYPALGRAATVGLRVVAGR
jgi:outer membrane cobalamin receptor